MEQSLSGMGIFSSHYPYLRLQRMRIRVANHPLFFWGYKSVLKVGLIMLLYRMKRSLIAEIAPGLFSIYTADSMKIITPIFYSILLCLQMFNLFLI